MNFKTGDYIKLVPIEQAIAPSKEFFREHKNEVFRVVAAKEDYYMVEPGGWHISKDNSMAARPPVVITKEELSELM